MNVDVTKNVKAMRVIRAMTLGLSRQEIAAAVRQEFPDTTPASILDTRNHSPTCGLVTASTPDRLRVFCRGINGKVGGINVALGYSSANVESENEGFNSLVMFSARYFLRSFVAPMFAGYKTVELHGHSAGGILAEALARLLKNQYRGVPLEVYTYGMPAPCYDGRWVSGENVVRQRWMNANDPVPLVPWVNLGPQGFLALYAFNRLSGVTVAEGPRPERFRQPNPGYRMESYGITSNVFPRFVGDPQARIQEWVNNGEEALMAHSADTYFRWFASWRNNHASQVPLFESAPAPEATAPVEVQLPAPLAIPSQVEEFLATPVRIRVDSAAVDFNNVNVGTVAVGDAPMSFLKINPRKAFRMARVGNAWHVTLGDVIVMVADSPKKPRTITRRLNAMLRAVGTDNTVFLANFLQALGDWMTAAANDTAVCNPPMRVDL